MFGYGVVFTCSIWLSPCAEPDVNRIQQKQNTLFVFKCASSSFCVFAVLVVVDVFAVFVVVLFVSFRTQWSDHETVTAPAVLQ